MFQVVQSVSFVRLVIRNKVYNDLADVKLGRLENRNGRRDEGELM